MSNNTSSHAQDQYSHLTPALAMTYGLPLLPLYFLFGPITILQGIYAKYFGLALTTIATVIFIARLFDAITDPLIGYLADRYRLRRGSSKPFIVSGGVLFILSSWFLYVPFGKVSEVYFLIWFLIFYLSYTLFEIPHLAWGSELSVDSIEKNKVYSLRSFFSFSGALLFFAIPLLPWFETSEFTPQTLKWSVLIAGSLMLPMLYVSIKYVPDSRTLPDKRAANGVHCLPKEKIGDVLRAIGANKPLRILTAAHICTGFGSGMCFAILFIFVDIYLGLGQHFALVYVASTSVSILTIKLWYQLANQWGKQAIWIIGMVSVVMGMVGTGVLVPGHSGWLPLLICMTLIYSGISAFSVMVPSLMSDVVDYGTWKFGTDRAATYFALYTFVNKTVGALGGSLGLAIVSWFGFDPTATVHSETAITGLRLGIAWIPALMFLLSIAFIARIPITAHRHAIIRRRLDARFARAQRVAKMPTTPSTTFYQSVN